MQKMINVNNHVWETLGSQGGIDLCSNLSYLRAPIRLKMKPEIHPDNYRLVVFKDMSNEYSFLSRSTANTKETIVWEDGNEYPLVKMEVSHKSHPFYTGKAQFVDTAGRIEKFQKKFAKFKK